MLLSEIKVVNPIKLEDLSLLNFLPANRSTQVNGQNNANVKRVKKIIKEKGFDPNQPIICAYIDGKLYILDGQHRVLACIELGEPVYLIVLNITTFEVANEYCKSVNNTKKKWDVMDYIHSIINDPKQSEAKRKDYETVLSWSKKYNVSISYLLDIVIGEGSTKAGGVLKNDLDFSLRTDSVYILNFALELAMLSNLGLRLMASKSFVRCVAIMLRNNVYRDNIKFHNKIKGHSFTFQPKEADSNDFVLTAFEKVLNKNLAYKIDLRNKKLGLKTK